jgi:Carboxypeptidase regulatory-like domain/TonB dependent receptor
MKRLQKPVFSVLSIIFCTMFLSFATFAQTITATISGTVSDPNGAIVPGATVSATSNETGLTKTTNTNSDGRYVITFLQPGTYAIKVSKQGFAETDKPNIKLETAQSVSLDLKLSVSADKATVEVTDDQTQLLVTESSGLESTIENKLVEDLPSGERSALAFINLVPGAIDGGFAQGRGEGLNENGNAQGPIGSPGNRNFFDSNFSVNGGRSATNDVLLDGVSNTIGDFNGIAVSPPQDSIREFKVVAGAYSAEYGRSGGGVVSISTKSGGKRYSGALYEYFQDGSLNANGWQRNRRGVRTDGTAVLPRQDISRHQYGGTFSGPVSFFNFGEGDSSKGIKKLEKTFFFFNYEGRRERNPFSREITLPTARMRTGDLGELLTGTPYTVTSATTRTTWATASGAPVITGQIFNPFGALVNYTQSVTNIATGAVTTSTVQGRAAFTGNNLSGLPACSGVRATACLDPVALAVLRFLPLPNTSGLVNNYVVSDLAVFNRSIYAGRIDHTFSEKHSIFGRYTYERRFTSEPNYFGGSPAANVRKVKDTFGNFTLNDAYNLSGSLVNNFRYGYTRARANQIPESQGFDPTTIGLPQYLKTFAPILKFPDLTIGGGTAGSTLAGEVTSGQIGGAGNNQPRDTHTIADGITFVKGSQTIKVGGEYRIYRFYPFQFFNPTGNFTFNRTFTRGPIGTTVPTIAADSGSSLASFFLGLPSAGSHEAVAPATILHKYPAVYFQDDWKISRKLVLNLGVRWDYETGTEETHGLVTNFDLNAPAPVQPVFATGTTYDAAALGLNRNLTNGVKGLLSFTDKPQSKTPKTRFAPRFGFAYSINDKTTVRGGFGLYYVPLSLEAPTVQGTNFSTGLAQSNQAGQILNGSTTVQNTTFVSDPFPIGGTTALATPPGTILGSRTRLGQQVFAVEPNRKAPYSQQWNVVFQRQLLKNTVLDISYVGGRGISLPIQGAELNQLSSSVVDAARASLTTPNTCGANTTTLALTIACPTINAFFNQIVSNPFAGQLAIPGSSLNGATVSRLQLLRPYPQYTSVQLFRPHWGDSYYHALQVNLQRRFTNGLSATVNYTWSKSIDTGGVGNGAAFLDATAIQDIYAFKREKSLSTFDVPHRFVASWSYELPFGKKKAFGKNWNGITNILLGGWQTSGSYSIQTGTPIAVTVPAFTTGLGNASTRPNRVTGNATLPNAVQNAKNGGVFFDTSLFLLPPDFVLGNASRTYNDVRRDKYRTLNLSVLKNIYWAEGRQKLQLRAEFLNAFNWVVLGTPVTSLGSGAVNANLTGFGQIRTQGNTPRNIQLVARYTF